MSYPLSATNLKTYGQCPVSLAVKAFGSYDFGDPTQESLESLCGKDSKLKTYEAEPVLRD